MLEVLFKTEVISTESTLIGLIFN